MMRAKLISPLLMILALLGITPATGAQVTTSPEKAEKFIQDIGNRGFALLAKYDDKDVQHREEFKTIVRQGFDLDLIGRFALGGAWRSASPEQQREYQQLFAAWVLDSYSRRLGAFKGETFSIMGSQPIADTDALVQTEIKRPDSAPIKAGWRVREIDGQLKIIDVVVEGVSMALTQRQEFASVVQRQGLDGLINELKVRVENLKKQPADQG